MAFKAFNNRKLSGLSSEKKNKRCQAVSQVDSPKFILKRSEEELEVACRLEV